MFRAIFILLICVLLASAAPLVMAGDGATPGQPAAETPVWTVWGAQQYALADDGAAIWIGGTGSVLRYDKQTQTFTRYSMLDGLPHTAVLTVAVDADGNRWFGGDAGLSRFDPAENWTHFRQSPGGLYSDLVDGIAVVGGDTLYLSHGLPSGAISRRDPDGTWRWFPNRETAIEADYAAIVQKRGTTPLWTVAGTEVWVGMRVFDGTAWHERPLPQGGSLKDLAADSRGHVWTFGGDYYPYTYEWDGSGWVQHKLSGDVYGRPTFMALTIDQSDNVWVGLREDVGIYYVRIRARIRQLGSTEYHSVGDDGVVALLPTPEGLWAIGNGWLMRPDFSLTGAGDGPSYSGIYDAVVGGDGALWFRTASYESGDVFQSLDDRGTLALEDDIWQGWGSSSPCTLITAIERSPGGFWYTSYCNTRTPEYNVAVRYRNGAQIWYGIPPPRTNFTFTLQEVTDIFTHNDRHTWFAVSDREAGARLIGLDDGGTPTNTAYDALVTVPIAQTDERIWVAVDARGQLWHSRASGLYRYTGSAWQLVYNATPVCDLVPAADGTLYALAARHGETACNDVVLTVRPDGEVDDQLRSVGDLVQSQAATVSTARHRNTLWVIGPDAAIWYIDRMAGGANALRRVSGEGLTSYTLPVDASAVWRFDVDRRGHVWLIDGSRLWRMEGPAPKPLPLHVYLPLWSKQDWMLEAGCSMPASSF
jgi:streptogramin lyase